MINWAPSIPIQPLNLRAHLALKESRAWGTDDLLSVAESPYTHGPTHVLPSSPSTSRGGRDSLTFPDYGRNSQPA